MYSSEPTLQAFFLYIPTPKIHCNTIEKNGNNFFSFNKQYIIFWQTVLDQMQTLSIFSSPTILLQLQMIIFSIIKRQFLFRDSNADSNGHSDNFD